MYRDNLSQKRFHRMSSPLGKRYITPKKLISYNFYFWQSTDPNWAPFAPSSIANQIARLSWNHRGQYMSLYPLARKPWISLPSGRISFTDVSFFYFHFRLSNRFWIDLKYVVLLFPVDAILVLSDSKTNRVSTYSVYQDNTYIILFNARIEELISGWRHRMETFSVLLALCDGNSPITSGFLWQGANNADIGVSLMWICTRC